MSQRPPYSGGRPPPAHGMQQGWSFTGPPPGHGFTASAGSHCPHMAATGSGFPVPHLQGAMHVPAGPMFHYAHAVMPQYGAQQFIPRPPQMPPHAPHAHRPRPPTQIYASKKEREKAKRERKEARKLAATPVAPLTDDVQPREFLNEAERQETLEWISERKAHFPSRENLAKKREAAAALAKSGGSEGRSRCDDRLFAVLQEQHRRGLLRTAGTEDLFRSAACRVRHRPVAKGPTAMPAPPSNLPVTHEGDSAVPPTAPSNCDTSPAEPDAKDADSAMGQVPAGGEGAGAACVAEGGAGCAQVTGGRAVVSEAENQTVGSKRGPPGALHGGCRPTKRQNNQGGGWAPVNPKPSERRPCLLHRLVAADVRQDRNLLLQVIRFFVNNNYLQGVDADSLQFPEARDKKT